MASAKKGDCVKVHVRNSCHSKEREVINRILSCGKFYYYLKT